MARRKVVFVIVEGASDETALGIALNQVFDKETVHIHIIHGDITTKAGVNSQNIVAKVGNEVRSYATSNHYKAADFKQIIHIVDTDAAYLAEDKVLEDSTCVELFYQDDGIHTNDVSKVIARNKQKTENLYRLRSCGNIWGGFRTGCIICPAIWTTCCMINEIVQMKKRKMMHTHLQRSTRIMWMHLCATCVNHPFR